MTDENGDKTDTKRYRGKLFTSEYQPPNRGRKPGMAKMLSTIADVSRKQIEDTVKAIMFEKTQAEAADIMGDPEACLFAKACASAALTAIAKGDMTTIDQLVEWAYTKKKELTLTFEEKHVPKTPEEREAWYKEVARQNATSASKEP